MIVWQNPILRFWVVSTSGVVIRGGDSLDAVVNILIGVRLRLSRRYTCILGVVDSIIGHYFLMLFSLEEPVEAEAVSSVCHHLLWNNFFMCFNAYILILFYPSRPLYSIMNMKPRRIDAAYAWFTFFILIKFIASFQCSTFVFFTTAHFVRVGFCFHKYFSLQD